MPPWFSGVSSREPSDTPYPLTPLTCASSRVDVVIADAHALGISQHSDNGFLERLSPQERRELAGLSSSKTYLQFLLSRVLLRTALLAWGGAPAAAWLLKAEPSGRPYLQVDGAVGLPSISLSHSGSTALCALSQYADVGIDIETDRARDIDAIATEVLAPSESLALHRMAGSARRQMFFQLWTLKEACSKALGTGMATPFRELVFALDPPRISFTSTHCAHAEFVSFIPQPDTAAALALLPAHESPEPHVRFYRMIGFDRWQEVEIPILASTARAGRPAPPRNI